MSLQLLLAMLEPRYPPTAPGVAGPPGHPASLVAGTAAPRLLVPTAPQDLDAAVDLSRKSETEAKAMAAAAMAAAAAAAAHAEAAAAAAAGDSDDEAPLDLKVRPPDSSGKAPVFPGLNNMPNPEQRAELLRIAEFYTSAPPPRHHLPVAPPTNSTPLPPSSRESSQERDVGSCEYCGADTRTADFVADDHREGVCNRGSIACTLCAKTFTLYSHYEAHKKCHQKLKQRQYPCQTCGKIFTSASNRNMHQRIHKGVRPFQCTPCGVFFRQKAHLQKHQKTQGHLQATELYEKKKREGTLGEAGVNNNTPSASATSSSLGNGNENGDDGLIIQTEDSEIGMAGSSSPAPVVESSSGGSSLTGLPQPAASAAAAAADSSSAEDDVSPTSSSPPISSSSTAGRRSRFKSSPKRKQMRPQHHSPEPADADGSSGLHLHRQEENEDEERQEKILSLVDYNDLTHGYECGQCAFSSHDLAVLKSHVTEEHLSFEAAVYKCSECQITFSKEFNLRIHNRKHETSSQFLPCDHCEQVFKVPNKLIKHMEGVHSVCPSCGDRQEDKPSLLRHVDEVHGDHNRNTSSRSGGGFHTSLAQFSPLNSLSSKSERAAKMRKVDSLAETIRLKQLQNHATSTLNGNDPRRSPLTSPLGAPRRRKNDLSAVKALLAAAAVTEAAASKPLATFTHRDDQPPMSNQSVHDLLRLGKGENNNILSSLKLPPTVRLPTRPVSGMTPPPPSSPPPMSLPLTLPLPLPLHLPLPLPLPLPPHLLPSVPSLPPPPPSLPPNTALPPPGAVVGPGQQIRGEVSVTIMPTRPMSRSDDSGGDPEENGLDLSMGNKRRGGDDDEDENQVSTTAKEEYVNGGGGGGGVVSVSGGMPGASAPPFPTFPFPFGGILPPVPPGTDPSLAEHLMKLTAAGLPPPPTAVAPPPRIEDLTAKPLQAVTSSLNNLPSTSSHPYTVLSAMLGKPPFQPVFPGMANGIFPKQNGSSAPPPPPTVVAAAAAAVVAESSKDTTLELDSKPFHCTYCRKEFSHLASLESHLEHMHAKDSKHACEACGKTFSSKSNLTAHRKIHSGERPFECGVCHKRFRQKAHLQKHETTHSSATPFKCSVCDKAFGHVSNLNTHMATHSDVRPYHCTDCGKSYKDSASFKRHRLQHTGERPYPCGLCPEAFIDSKSLRRHREVSHPTAPLGPHGSEVGDHDNEDEEEEELVDDEMNEEEEDEEDEGLGASDRDTSGADNSSANANASTSSAGYSSFESQEDATSAAATSGENGGQLEDEEDEEIKVDCDDEDEEEEEEEEVVSEMAGKGRGGGEELDEESDDVKSPR